MIVSTSSGAATPLTVGGCADMQGRLLVQAPLESLPTGPQMLKVASFSACGGFNGTVTVSDVAGANACRNVTSTMASIQQSSLIVAFSLADVCGRPRSAPFSTAARAWPTPNAPLSLLALTSFPLYY
jgi:hypothetical protein